LSDIGERYVRRDKHEHENKLQIDLSRKYFDGLLYDINPAY
jgi:hypothetical protein